MRTLQKETVDSKKQTQCCRDLINWYWNHGIKRTAREEVSTHGWLYPLYQVLHQADLVSKLSSQKPAFAIWGPSQVGKSTLMSRYLDSEDGNESALQWGKKDRVSFDTGPDKLNPFNLQADGSSCVTRFVSCNSIEDPAFPVELKIAEPRQVIHALAAGYLSECDLSEAKGHEVALTNSTLAELASRLASNNKADPVVAQKAFELVDLLGLLARSETKSGRYLALRNSDPSLLLTGKKLLFDEASLKQTRNQLLWDENPLLSGICDDLLNYRHTLLQSLENQQGTISCSYDLVRLLLDMGAIHNEKSAIVLKDIGEFGWKAEAGGIKIGKGLPNKLFKTKRDFALLQGLVWELVIPLNAGFLQKTPQGQILHSLLQSADLLDFPGVSNVGQKIARLSKKELELNEGLKIFSDVLKRGKTASMVASTSQAGAIHGFIILLRVMSPLANPDQLLSGLQTWWRFTTGTVLDTNSKADLPVNLGLTFFSTLVNDVLRNKDLPGIGQAIQHLSALGPIATPKISRAYAIHYPKYAPFQSNKDEDLQSACKTIQSSEAFSRLFAGDAKALESGFLNDGSDYMLTNLVKQAQNLDIKSLLLRRNQEIESRLGSLIADVAPAMDEKNERRKSDLLAFQTDVIAILGEEGNDSCKEVSFSLRSLLSMGAEDLVSLPIQAKQRNVNLITFVDEQVGSWRSKQGAFPRWHTLGIKDSALGHRVVGYLADAIDRKLIAKWINDNFGSLKSPKEGTDARRHLAIRISDLIFSGGPRPSHKPVGANGEVETSFARLDQLAQDEANHMHSYNTSPHYLSVVYPFLIRIGKMAEESVLARKPQPGDSELLEIRASLTASAS